jgi:hypothetical protein
MIGFSVLTLFIYSQNFKIDKIFDKLSWPFFIMLVVIIGFTAEEIFRLRILEMNIKTDAILSTFGNVNMMSEFLILSWPFLILWGRWEKDKIPQMVKFFVLFAVGFFIFYGRSRSAGLGLLAWVVYKLIKKDLNVKEITALVWGLIIFAISHFTAPNVAKISKFTPESISERSSLYQGSVELMMARPFGIPPGQFMNEIVPYLLNKTAGPNEFAFFDQPHSEFLKWGIQFGWAFLALCLAFFGLLIYELYKKQRDSSVEVKKESGFFTECLIVLIPQLVFQFPFENPASILCIAVAFGLFLSTYKHGIKLKLKRVQILLGACEIFCIVY